MDALDNEVKAFEYRVKAFEHHFSALGNIWLLFCWKSLHSLQQFFEY